MKRVCFELEYDDIERIVIDALLDMRRLHREYQDTVDYDQDLMDALNKVLGYMVP